MIGVVFKGAICYNKCHVDSQIVNRSKLYQLFQNNSSILTGKTILHDKDKIQVKFFQNPCLTHNSQFFEITLKNLLTP